MIEEEESKSETRDLCRGFGLFSGGNGCLCEAMRTRNLVGFWVRLIR